MRILISSHALSPSVGGIESCSLALARAFIRAGHEVQIVTQTPSDDPKNDHGLKVYRRPALWTLLHRLFWCDICFHNNISLRTAWPLVFIRRPWVVTTATWIKKPNGSVTSVDRFKKWLLRFATNIYISKAVEAHIGHKGFVVPNPYDSETFHLASNINRDRSLVFLGRLVSDKGCDLLIHSLAKLRDAGVSLPLTIIGAGPEETRLKSLASTLELDGWVSFTGALRGKELANELNRHKVMVVPSRWEEPFGVVAVEDAACGCLVVGSSGGGLAEAIGNCGITFKSGDSADLARAIHEILENRELTERCLKAVPSHLRSHQIESVAQRYLHIFEQPCPNGHLDQAFSS